MRLPSWNSQSMSSGVGPSRGSGAALYGPPISRSLVDQLESQLRTLGVPAIAVPAAAAPTVKHCEASPSSTTSTTIGQRSGHLGIDQLERALNCMKEAARAMAVLDDQAVGPDERTSMNEALSGLERRLHAFEGEFAAMAEKLRDARRETEEHKQRSLAAETKLDSLMAAVAKMIAPLDPAEAAMRLKTPPASRAAFIDDEVRA